MAKRLKLVRLGNIWKAFELNLSKLLKLQPHSYYLKAQTYGFEIFALFYKNKLYKNTQAEICPKFKNKLKTITRLKFQQTNLRILFDSCTRIEMYK